MARRPRGSRVLAALGVGIVALCLGIAHAQEANDRVGDVREQAAQRESRARALEREAAAMLAELDAMDRELNASQRSQRALARRQGRVEIEYEEAKENERRAQEAVVEARRKLERRLLELYKNRAIRGLPPIYGAQGFQQGLRAQAGLERLSAADAELFADVQRKREAARVATEEELSKLVELTGTKTAYDKRRKEEQQKRIERRNLVALLEARARRELRAASELRGLAERLEVELARGQRPARSAGPGLRKGRVPRPVEGEVRSGFGRQVDRQFSTVVQRTGIEIEAGQGQAVRAVGPGRVVFAGWLRSYGQLVMVDHGDDTVTVSGYLDELLVEPDDTVLQGQIIGSVGDTGLSGPGLYFELRRGDEAVDPEDWFLK